MPYHYEQHVQNLGPNLYVCNGKSAYIIPHVTAYAVMSCAHCTAHACRQASFPYENVVCQKLLNDQLFTPAELYLSKLGASHFSTSNMRIANENMLKMLLIAMDNKNKADCNENHRICAENLWNLSKSLLIIVFPMSV